MPLDISELLEPIPGPEPGGAFLRYEPIYDQIRLARTEEDDLPSGDWERERKTADYAAVLRLSQEVLKNQSKDLQIAAWLAEALLKQEGFAGFASGIDLIAGLLENFWDHLHPELEDDDAEMRAAPLVWVGEYLDRAVRLSPIVQDGFDLAAYRDSRSVGYEEDADTYEKRDIRNDAIANGRITGEVFDAAFNSTSKAWYKTLVASIDTALASVDALDRVSEEKFGRDAPRFSPLSDAIKEVRQVASQLLAQKLAREPDPIEAVVVPAGEDALMAAPTGDAAGGAPASGVPAVFAAPSPAAVGGQSGADASIAAAARFLRKEAPANPGPYLMLRGYRWGELRADGGQIDPAILVAPPTEVRTRVKGLLLEEKWSDLLEAAEEVMATPFGRGWLDLQRYVVNAADALGDEYASLASAVRGSLRALLADIPDLPAMSMADDTPTANAETRAWLRAEGLLPESTEGGEEEVVVPLRRTGFDPQQRAEELKARGRHGEAVDVLMQAAARERSPRGRFLRRTQAAAILVESGMASVALPILEDLSEIINTHSLEGWEEAETVAEPLALLYRCNVAIDGDASGVQDLFMRVARLDPMQAMTFGSASASE